MKRISVSNAPGLWILVALFIGAVARPCPAATETVLDTFSTVSYSNQDGTASWSTDWLEENDDNAPGSGWISIHSGSDSLRIRGANHSSSVAIRRGVDLSRATSAVFSFDYDRTPFNSWWDSLTVEISDNGGSTWDTVVTIGWLGSTSGSWNDDISAYRSAETWIRFVASGSLSPNERVYIDNVRIAYEVPDAAQLVAHYALEGDATDSSGNGHNGSSQGTVAYQRAKICDGVQLDGNGYLTVPDNSDFDLPDALTMMAWIHPDTLSVADHTEGLYCFLSKDTNSEFHVQSDGALYWWWQDDNLTTPSGVIDVDVWTHVAFVYSRSEGSARVFVNGVQIANQAYNSAFPVNNDSLYIGTDITTGGGEVSARRFYGSIDEVRIYDGALTEAQVVEQMNETDPCALPTPLAEWRFDECAYEGSAPLAEDTQGSYDLVAQGVVESEPAGVVGRAAMADRSTDYFLAGTDVPMTGDWTVSTWFRMPFTHTEGSRYHVLGAMAGGGNDLMWVDRNASYRWGGWANSVSATGSFRFSTLGDGWHHMVLIAASGRTDLHIDGVFTDSISLQPSGDLHYVGNSYEQAGGEEGFRADLDEFLVFSGALSADQIQSLYQLQSAGLNLDGTTREEILCAAAIDHYEIVHDSAALTCVPETVTVRACIDADCTELYADDITIDLSPAGWIGGDSQTLSGGSGTFRLRHTTPETVTLSVSSQNPSADNASQCVDGSGGSSCSLMFYEAGFIFDVPDMTSCSSAENIRIAAVRADATGEQCVGDDSFADTTRIVYFWSGYQEPATGTHTVSVNGGAVAGASPGTAVSISFDAQAESLLSVSYDDAGRVELSARFDGTGDETGLTMVGSDSFVAVPDHLEVTATTDGTTALDNTTSEGDPHWPAGEDFVVAVSGVCADGSVTPNFAATTNFSVAAANPAPGVFSGGPLAESDYGGGTVTGTAAYSEVGTVTLKAEVSDYLGTGIDITGTAVVGRFTPYSFAASPNSPEFAPGCTTGGFTYIGQPFAYTVYPAITITALNKDGDTTENYTGDWWKIADATLTDKTYAAETGTLDLSSLPAGDPSISDLGGGVGLLTFSDGGGLSFVRNDTPDAPFDAEISLSINVLDADGIAATANPVTFGAASAGNGIAFSGDGKQMFWGRLTLQNAYGSERVPLAMPFRAETYDGTAFVANTLGDCTSVALNLLSLSNASGTVTADNPITVGSGSSSASLSNPFTAGDEGLVFSAPGSEGYIQVQVDLSSLPWLRYDWDGDGSLEGPSARATFGVYKGSQHHIYLRETYR
ncbi:hypothetical protein DSCW_21970 [Desulfosarcina widdelii]|uniref:LamG-like jellyroll fold domain-containing protein n=1 Tax=Desulfosarcina widdelii TaxID=947919 RepID=A0A5K7Z289_9BACT|nr:LamG domain-containing protein [Desulfosarcina widdelii]BBO74780.1 hypothetical protein DSCW_21970 [Desulfosarcina widdelii]